MAVSQAYRESYVNVAGAKVQVLQGGSGAPLLALHGAGGSQGWMRYHQVLAEHFTVYVPSHPGYGPSERPEWLDTMTDMAHFYHDFIDTLGLERPAVLGTSMGGWLAAEIAAMCPHHLSRMVLVANRAAAQQGLAEKGYRLAVNCGIEGGQTVEHLHMHVLGGRQLSGALG